MHVNTANNMYNKTLILEHMWYNINYTITTNVLSTT